MTKKSNTSKSTEYQAEKLENFKQELQNFYETENGKKLKGKPLTQADLAKKLNMTQPAISRILKGYEIDWETGDVIKEASSNDLIELTKGTTIVKPSTFFISVSRSRRKKLKEALLLYFPSTKSQYGIIYIKEITTPSGLLVFSDDHNLEYNLANKDYLREIMDENKSK